MTRGLPSLPPPVPSFRDRPVSGKMETDLDGQTTTNITSLGVDAYKNDSTSDFTKNTTIGHRAGMSMEIPDAAGNVAVGEYALGDVTTGSENTGIGFAASPSDGTVDSTVNVGYGAYGAGTRSISMGRFAAANGVDSIAIGRDSATAYDDSVIIGPGQVDGAPGDIIIGSSTHSWKFGYKQTASVALDTGHYIEVEIDGVIVKLAIVT